MFSQTVKSKTHTKQHIDTMMLLDRVEHSISTIGMSFPDIGSFDFNLEKDKWKYLPNNISSGVKVMGLHLGDDYRACLVYYEKNAYIDPHYHSREFEVIRLLKGSVINKRNKRTYREGDLITIERGDLHHIVSNSDEVYMYIVFSESESLIDELFNKDYL